MAEKHYLEALQLIDTPPEAVEKMLAEFNESVQTIKMEKAMNDLGNAIEAGLVDERKLEALVRTFEADSPSEEHVEGIMRDLLTP